MSICYEHISTRPESKELVDRGIVWIWTIAGDRESRLLLWLLLACRMQ